MSDPFQPIEKERKYSLDCLKVFADTQYPFIVSTKGKLVAEPEYLELIAKCNCVVQISMACSLYDKIEQGAPNFEQRLEMLNKVSKVSKRTIVRVQPYLIEAHNQIMQNIPKFKECGAYGVIFESMKFSTKQKGLVKVGGDLIYPIKAIKPKFEQLKKCCHDNGLKFYSGENRLRSMGDDLCCCGIGGLDGFIPNKFNINHFINDNNAVEPTKAQNQPCSASCFKGKYQSAGQNQIIKNMSFSELMLQEYYNHKDYYNDVLSIKARK